MQFQKLAKLEHLKKQMQAYSRSNVQGAELGQMEEARSWSLVHSSRLPANKGLEHVDLGSRGPKLINDIVVQEVGPGKVQGPYMKANLGKIIGARTNYKED